MHSSRMCTVRCNSRLLKGGLPRGMFVGGEGVCPRGITNKSTHHKKYFKTDFNHCQTKLWKGNVFTSVCQEFCSLGGGGGFLSEDIAPQLKRSICQKVTHSSKAIIIMCTNASVTSSVQKIKSFQWPRILLVMNKFSSIKFMKLYLHLS